MCGRADDDFGPAGWETLRTVFGVHLHAPPSRAEVRPTDDLMFLRPVAGGWDAPRGRWGLVPRGLSLSDARRYATFNARVESLEERPLFRDAFRTARCVIPLAGFWEWPTWDGVKRRVRLDRPDGRPLLAAGLWSVTDTPDGPLTSCTVVTRPPTPDIEHVHDRMPALLLTRDVDAWVHATPREARAAALTSWPQGVLRVT